MLRQLGNVFIVQPEILKSYLTESYLARIENRLLRPFVMMRTDYSDYSRKFWSDVFDIGMEGDGVGGSGTGAAGSKLAPGWATGKDLSHLGSEASTADNRKSIFGGLMKEFTDLGLTDRPGSISGPSSAHGH